MLYDETEKFDAQINIRGPTSVAERIKKIKQHERLSLNKFKLSLLETGIFSYEWGVANWDRLKAVRKEGEAMKFMAILPRVLDIGLETLEWVAKHREELMDVRPAESADAPSGEITRLLNAGLESLRRTQKR